MNWHADDMNDSRVFCAHVIHTVANKILPILLSSELALSRCTDAYVQRHLENIRFSASELRDLVVEAKHRLHRDAP